MVASVRSVLRVLLGVILLWSSESLRIQEGPGDDVAFDDVLEAELADDLQQAGDDQICFDSICVNTDAPDLKNVFEDPDEDVAGVVEDQFSVSVAEPGRSRTLLLSLSEPFHGSTAFLGMLMSSPQIATLCKGETWQCEGGYIMLHHSTNRSHESIDWDWQEALSIFSNYWDMSRPILLDKTPNLIRHVPENHPRILEAIKDDLPPRFKHHLIEKVNVQYTLMWRPVCLWLLAKKINKTGFLERHLAREGEEFEQMVEAHKWLLDQNIPVTVINMADLMWKPKSSAKRLRRELPELGELDPEYVPQFGKDHFEHNRFKAIGSVASFGRKLDPGAISYHVHKAECQGDELYAHTDSETLDRISIQSAYLASFSRSNWPTSSDSSDVDLSAVKA